MHAAWLLELGPRATLIIVIQIGTIWVIRLRLEIGENRHIEHVGMDSMDTLPPRGNVRLPHQGVLGRKSAVVPKIAPDRPKKSREALSEAVPLL